MTVLAEGEIPLPVDAPAAPAPAPARRARGATAAGDGASAVVRAGERLVERIEALVEEMGRLRADNDDLRRQVRDAVSLLERAASAAAEPHGRRRHGPTDAVGAPPRRRRPRVRGARGRATPPEVTTQVVEAALAKLGEGTAAEIAAEITRAGVRVSGRAIRFLAERAGAETYRGDDGQRRYRLPRR